MSIEKQLRERSNNVLLFITTMQEKWTDGIEHDQRMQNIFEEGSEPHKEYEANEYWQNQMLVLFDEFYTKVYDKKHEIAKKFEG